MPTSPTLFTLTQASSIFKKIHVCTHERSASWCKQQVGVDLEIQFGVITLAPPCWVRCDFDWILHGMSPQRCRYGSHLSQMASFFPKAPGPLKCSPKALGPFQMLPPRPRGPPAWLWAAGKHVALEHSRVSLLAHLCV